MQFWASSLKLSTRKQLKACQGSTYNISKTSKSWFSCLEKKSLVHSYSVLFWLHNKWQSFIILAVKVGSKVQRTELHQTSVLADLGPLDMEPWSLFTSEFGPVTSNANVSCTNEKDLLPETHLSPSVQTRQPCFKRFLSLHVLLTLLLHFLFLLFL